MYENIFKPIKIGDLEIKNRVVFAPTSMGYSREKYFEKILNIVKGETGLIIIGDISVADSFHRGIPTLSSDEHIEYFKHLNDEVHQYGCKISAQLFHPDYDIDEVKSFMRTNSSSREEVRKIIKESMNNYINKMSRDKIDTIQEAFINAAIRAKKAEFDMVQVHGDRLLGSFSSSIFNKREDEFGIDIEGRAKMSVDIVEKIKEKVDIPVDYKLGIRKENPNIGKGGPTIDEVETFVKLLDEAGVDSFHVSIANHSAIKDTIPANNHPYLKGEGCFLDLAREVKKHTNKVVCAVGKLQTPKFINNVLEDIDMIGLSRQLIADDKWAQKVKEEKIDSIDFCKFCNVKCTNSLMNGTSFGCILNNEK